MNRAGSRDAAPEPGDAARRDRRHARARARLRQPRLPARRLRADRPPPGDPPLDRLPPRVPRLVPLAGARPGKYTGLFFLDDATAFAAGHRPCALCRREDYLRVLELAGEPGADALDARLHAERTGMRTLVLVGDLPDGAFVLHDGSPHIVLDGTIRPWSFAGYGAPVATPDEAELITPRTLVDVLRAGWKPAVPFVMGLAITEDGTARPGDHG